MGSPGKSGRFNPGSPYVNDTWTTRTVNTIAPNTSTWCLGLPTQTTVTNSSTAPGGAPITRTVAYNNPDYASCRQTQKVIEPNSATYKVVEDYGYDGYGNLHTDTETGVAMTVSPATRVTTIDWTANGQFPQTITNPLSQSITLGFDPSNGMQTSQTDPNNTTSNPLTTTWQYDTLARKTQENRPDGTYTVWTYNDCASWGGCLIGSHALALAHYIYNTNGSIQNDGTTWFDQVDRPLIANTKTLSGGYDRNEVRYDSLGRVAQQSMPCLYSAVATPCTYWTTFSYDVLNRVIEIERPVNASSGQAYCNPTTVPPVTGCQGVAYSYQGRTTTVTDPQGKNTTKINLVTGSLARTQDHTGFYINFKYDAFGSVLSVTDSLSNTLNTMTYDYGVQAFQRTSNDADLGARSNTYDALGEVTAYSDAKAQNFSVMYDALSRPTSRTEPDLTTTWTWGNTASSFNIGKLQSASAASSVGTYLEVYGYDSKTRLSTEQITIPGDAAYTYTRTYNATTGLLDTLQYPVSTSSYQLKLQYAYQNGILQQISDVATGTHYWTANTINPRGQYTQETLGNSVVVNHALDAVTGWVSSIQAGVGGGAALQNNSYLFDEVGNLTQRQNNNLPVVTENVYYDNLYRLDHTVGDSSTQMSYDAMGRIATWAVYGGTPNVNDYTTQQPGCTYYSNSQLHALRQSTQGTGVGSSCYDANGNMTSSSWRGAVVQTLTWTSYNQPNLITGGWPTIGSGTSTSQFFYDENHQRYKQIASYSGSLETTFYVGGLLEKMINSSGTSYRHYIPAGNNTVVYTRLSTGTNSTYYLTKDHLGSTAAITDQTGALVVSEKFSATGINENTGAQQAAMASVTRHEFTGHEGLDNAGLWMVNMNGRIYVSSGSRFLSPDPNVTDPGNTQSFNRYSYVNNNPLSEIDPTGFCGNSLNYIAGSEMTWTNDQNGNFVDTGFVSPGYYTSVPDSSPCQAPPSDGAPYPPSTPPPVLQQLAGPLPKMPPMAQSETFDQCMAAASSGANSSSPEDSVKETFDNLGQAHSALDASVERLAGASALSVGRAFGGGQTSLTAPSNAAVAQYGASVKSGLETVAPYLKFTGYVLGGASILNGIRTGGPAGGAYATADFGIETALSSTLIGVGAAFAYDRVGGTRAVGRAFGATGNIQACNAVAGSFVPAVVP
jgi:RHS repeat-associated protein